MVNGQEKRLRVYMWFDRLCCPLKLFNSFSVFGPCNVAFKDQSSDLEK